MQSFQKLVLETGQITIDFNAKHEVIKNYEQKLELAQHEVSLFVMISPK